jgi:uncharacterized membrane protein YhaH (DUF805 family)
MRFRDAMQSALFANYWSGEGRASRTEFWYFNLFFVAVLFALIVLGNFCRDGGLPGLASSFGMLETGFQILMICPALAVWVRRLHDVGFSGWWLLLALVPFVGGAVLLALASRRSDNKLNEWGPPGSTPHLMTFPLGHFFTKYHAA